MGGSPPTLRSPWTCHFPWATPGARIGRCAAGGPTGFEARCEDADGRGCEREDEVEEADEGSSCEDEGLH